MEQLQRSSSALNVNVPVWYYKSINAKEFLSMAYIHKKTFDIIRDCETGSLNSDWFYVDDILADTIQVLNSRGYTTVSCHAGSAYCVTRKTVLRNVRDNTGAVPDIRSIANAFRAKVGKTNILRIDRVNLRDFSVTQRIYSPQSTVITFAEDVYFKKLPKGAIYKDKVLSFVYPRGLTGFDFLSAQYEYCHELFNWSCTLPMNLFLKIN